ncbi:MAG: hypothetical protein J6S67_10065 [Methanobrevibacter sp.]|nr:hypothetical protein [Methanobrevibacter sp.]
MTTLTTTDVAQLKINRLTKTQFDNASSLSNLEEYQVDPEFTGGKILASNTDGDIVETDVTTATIANSAQKLVLYSMQMNPTITLADNTMFYGGGGSGAFTSLTINLPTQASIGFLCQVVFSSSSTPTTLTYSNTIKWVGDDIENNVFTPIANKRYNIMFNYDSYYWVAYVKGVAA